MMYDYKLHLVIQNPIGLPVGVVRLTVTGCLMGGVFGIGTVIAVFLTGPLVELFTGNGQ